MKQKRDVYFDSLKFVLIALVVIGHVIERNRESPFCLALYNTIYLFHMPLFVFVSGYFSKKYSDNKKTLKTLLLLIESLLVFQLLHKLPSLINGKESVLSVIVFPAWTIWYLYSLIAWKIIVYITPPDWLRHYKAVLLLTFTVCLSAGFIPIGSTLSFQRTMVFMPFFFLGYYCGRGVIDFRKFSLIKTLSILILLSAFIGMLFINRNLDFILYGSSPYQYDVLLSLTIRCVHLVSALITGMAVISLTRPMPEKYNRIGRSTLFIYLYHSFVIITLMKIVSRLDIPQNEVYAFLETFIVCIALVIIIKIKFLHTLLNPISKLIIK